MASSKKQSKPTKQVPTAALKRFAADLAADPNNKFLQINRERVIQFVDRKSDLLTGDSDRKAKQASKIPGILDYSFLDSPDKNSIIHLQKLPEFQSSLGIRSRFGEGDGSFFDHWLNCDVQQSNHVVDKDGLPILRFSLEQTQGGFKKHINDFRSGNSPKRSTCIKSYEERRLERLAKEAAAGKPIVDNSGVESTSKLPSLPPVTRQSSLLHSDSSVKRKSSVHFTDAGISSPIEDDELPSLDINSITPAERDNYFGHQARATFFDYYRSLARQQLNFNQLAMVDPTSPADSTRNIDQDTHMEKKQAVFASSDDEEVEQLYSPPPPSSGLNKMESKKEAYSRLRRRQKDVATAEHENHMLVAHLSAPLQQSAMPSQRPPSARTKFLIGCASHNIYPQPSWIIRRELTTILNVSSLGMGDTVACILAETIGMLPMLEGIYIADNQLTDASLVPIINHLADCAQLKELDISKNKVDGRAAEALRVFLSSNSCNLTVLSMCNANIDDNEASKFMLAIAIRHTIRNLNMAENLLGSHEITNAVIRKVTTAGESIGKLLQNASCSLTRLRLTWNMIRFASGVALVQSLSVNTSLTYLDVSYNGLAQSGGEALGEALSYNKSLITLNIAHNNLTPRAAVTIFSGVRSCPSIKEVDISENPIGLGGAMALLSLNLAEGYRIAIDIKGCSLKVHDPTCWFDYSKLDHELALRMDAPYERAICTDLLRMVANSDEYVLEKFVYYDNPDSEASARSLDFGFGAVQRVSHFDGGGGSGDSGEVDGEDAILYGIASDLEGARTLYRETFSQVFKRYDTNLSGGLDWRELMVILNELGLESSLSVVNKLLQVYDADGSGVIEEEEFINFLSDIKKERDAKNKNVNGLQTRYLFVKESESARDGAPYVPPSKGLVKIVVHAEKVIPEFVRTATTNDVQSVINASKSSVDSTILFSCALNVMRLSFTEAFNFYNIMVKDHAHNSMMDVMLKLVGPILFSTYPSSSLIYHFFCLFLSLPLSRSRCLPHSLPLHVSDSLPLPLPLHVSVSPSLLH